MYSSHSSFPFHPMSNQRGLKRERRKPKRKMLVVEPLESRQLMATYTVDFGDLSLAPDSHWYGPDPTGTVNGSFIEGKFRSGGIDFPNTYSTTGSAEPHFWLDFAYSNETDTATTGSRTSSARLQEVGTTTPTLGLRLDIRRLLGSIQTTSVNCESCQILRSLQAAAYRVCKSRTSRTRL
jgi:hypothetical protein